MLDPRLRYVGFAERMDGVREKRRRIFIEELRENGVGGVLLTGGSIRVVCVYSL